MFGSFGKKVGNFFRGVGKKVKQAYGTAKEWYGKAKGFGKKVMKGLDDIGVGDIARSAGSELVETGKQALRERGVPITAMEYGAKVLGQATPEQRMNLAKGVAQQVARYGAGKLKDKAVGGFRSMMGRR